MDITIKHDKNISNPTIQHVTAIIPNYSQRPLSDVEVTVLNRGPDFIPTLRIHPSEIRCDSEIRLNYLPPSATFAATTNDFQSRSSLNRIQMNMTSEELRALKSLRKDESIIICKDDKGRSLVVLDKNVYIESGISLLQGNKFKLLKKDPTINREKLFN
ncbi:hypothetical protein GJ496_009164 [Pomphorhynchus laevis]|nr:hypothetical protein GJ496_009164 [Pomphorhynchus laevis]